jgi:hypothetical protein
LSPAVVNLAVARLDLFAELVLEPLRLEVALLFGNPLLQSKVRLDDESAHDADRLMVGAL